MAVPRAVLFDFDFTLGDSSKGIAECIAHACSACGRGAPSESEIRGLIGLSLPVIHGRLGGCKATEPAFVAAFHQRADIVMEPATVLFPEALSAVAAVRRAGGRTGIVSTKYRWRLEGVLGRRGHRELFDLIIGLEDVPAPKPDPAGLLNAAKRLELATAEVLYIGDHAVDADAAKAAGVQFLGVLTGATTAAEFRGWGVDCIGSLAELPGWLGISE